jgi:predicted peptidase
MKRFLPALLLMTGTAAFSAGCASGQQPAADLPAPVQPAVALPAAQDAKPIQVGQHPDSFKGTITFTLNYLVFLPEDYGKDPAKKWPLMIFLHGSGERGNDVNMVKAHGPPKIVETQKDFPFILVSPQCPAGTGWHVPELNQLLDHIMAGYSVDADRVYATGLSMGGFATWDWATQSPDRFAAIAPMSGGGNATNAHRIAKLPIWVFHGEADPVVPIAKSQEMVDALKKLGADVQFTHYPGVGHDCWSLAYGNPELYTWMLSHHRGETPRPATQPAAN